MSAPFGTVGHGRQPTSTHPKPTGPVQVAAAAQTAVALRKVKQAQDACRKASQRLAQAQDLDVYAQRTCSADHDVDAVAAVIRLALSEHTQVDVVVLASPS